eukprot:scaffold30158_cov66-Phaeocystis_antarctica.AAC.1
MQLPHTVRAATPAPLAGIALPRRSSDPLKATRQPPACAATRKPNLRLHGGERERLSFSGGQAKPMRVGRVAYQPMYFTQHTRQTHGHTYTTHKASKPGPRPDEPRLKPYHSGTQRKTARRYKIKHRACACGKRATHTHAHWGNVSRSRLCRRRADAWPLAAAFPRGDLVGVRVRVY